MTSGGRHAPMEWREDESDTTAANRRSREHERMEGGEGRYDGQTDRRTDRISADALTLSDLC